LERLGEEKWKEERVEDIAVNQGKEDQSPN